MPLQQLEVAACRIQLAESLAITDCATAFTDLLGSWRLGVYRAVFPSTAHLTAPTLCTAPHTAPHTAPYRAIPRANPDARVPEKCRARGHFSPPGQWRSAGHFHAHSHRHRPTPPGTCRTPNPPTRIHPPLLTPIPATSASHRQRFSAHARGPATPAAFAAARLPPAGHPAPHHCPAVMAHTTSLLHASTSHRPPHSTRPRKVPSILARFLTSNPPHYPPTHSTRALLPPATVEYIFNNLLNINTRGPCAVPTHAPRSAAQVTLCCRQPNANASVDDDNEVFLGSSGDEGAPSCKPFRAATWSACRRDTREDDEEPIVFPTYYDYPNRASYPLSSKLSSD
ncbi:hypothetical protein C8J57DRAFT_1238437 [Mycena rebaudengoi]|nr:hypothetical protein C8J57DRAFT_1238437 [Mycena rebaudengoi]